MPNRHFLVKFWKCQKVVSILPHEAKALQELFCLQPIVFDWRQNSSSSYLASWGKIKKHDFTLADQDWIGPIIFKMLVDQDWIRFNFTGSRLDLEWKISHSAHLCRIESESNKTLSSHFCWIRFYFFGSGLDSDLKVSQSAHVCYVVKTARAANSAVFRLSAKGIETSLLTNFWRWHHTKPLRSACQIGENFCLLQSFKIQQQIFYAAVLYISQFY